jgi:hypothetical protein
MTNSGKKWKFRNRYRNRLRKKTFFKKIKIIFKTLILPQNQQIRLLTPKIKTNEASSRDFKRHGSTP